MLYLIVIVSSLIVTETKYGRGHSMACLEVPKVIKEIVRWFQQQKENKGWQFVYPTIAYIIKLLIMSANSAVSVKPKYNHFLEFLYILVN